MSIALDRLRDAGLMLSTSGGQLVVSPASKLTPELRALAVADKAEIIAALNTNPLYEFRHALRLGYLHVCSTCDHFSLRPGKQPDGWCNHHAIETWAAVPFPCPQYQADDPEAR